MRRLLGVALLLGLVGPAPAADANKPNTLTPREAADGWLLLFDGATTFGWDIAGEAAVKDGALVLGGERGGRAKTTTAFGDIEFHYEFRFEGKDGSTFTLITGEGASQHGTGFFLRSGQGWQQVATRVEYDPVTHKQVTQTTYSLPGGQTASQKSTGGGSLRNRIGFGIPIEFGKPAGGKLFLRNVKLKPLGLKPLFNGKDLSGWKKYEGDKRRSRSQFRVTPEGELTIKNGPGDLQTEGQWADFILQAQCRTNGERLNSGIFFRCIPGQYQNGYEAQIHNGFGKEKEYTVQEYDPKTHQPAGKKKVKSAALDFGTGAIYRRVPARSQAAKDHEWFTLTLVAEGRHFATWVNGVQQADWTDNRPPHENPRNGCRVQAGPISLQGHDPTTDLSFRHFRIKDLEEKTAKAPRTPRKEREKNKKRGSGKWLPDPLP